MAINFLNTVAVDDSVLFVDTINDRVGIGTDSPSAKLDVEGGMSLFRTTLTNNDDWQNSAISITERDNVGSTQAADKYSPNLNFHWSSRVSNSLWMSSAGQLNWGEYSAAGIPSGDGRINAATFSGDHLGTINTATTGTTQTAGDNSTKIATTAYADAAAAAVPIGNYLPLAGGTMTGSIKIRNAWDSSNLTGNSIYAQNSLDGFGFGVGTGISTWWSWSNTAGLNSMINVANDGDYIDFRTLGNNAVRIDSDGNVGIGTTSPGHKLDVYTNTDNGYVASFSQDNATGWGVLIDTDGVSNNDPALWVKNATSTVLWAAQSGNVGIGTASPSQKLDVVGNIELNGALYISNSGIYQQSNSDVSGLELVANVSLSFYRAAFFDYVIQKEGNVRAGTVFACNDGGSVEYTETSTNDIGDTSDVVLSVDISGGNMRLLADAATSGWSVKSLIRAI